MNNTEQFDEWIRGEMARLDDLPDHFRQADIWQKLQTELHPVSEKKSFFVALTRGRPCGPRAESSHYRIAAAVALLLLAGGIWWEIQSAPIQVAVNQVTDKSQNKVVLQEKQTLPVANKDGLKEEVTFKKQAPLRKQSKEILRNFVKVQNFGKVEIQVPSVTPAESHTNVISANIAEIAKSTVPISEEQLPEVIPHSFEKPNQSIAKATPKPKFKIVHANELADYQKAELAEVREKEAKAKGFVVINWKANATTHTESSLMSYFKNKSSKAD